MFTLNLCIDDECCILIELKMILESIPDVSCFLSFFVFVFTIFSFGERNCVHCSYKISASQQKLISFLPVSVSSAGLCLRLEMSCSNLKYLYFFSLDWRIGKQMVLKAWLLKRLLILSCIVSMFHTNRPAKRCSVKWASVGTLMLRNSWASAPCCLSGASHLDC